MQLDRNLHPIGSYCMLFVRELYAIRSCLYGIRSYSPFYRTGHSVVLHIRSYSPFGRTEHSVVLPIRSYRAFGRTPHSIVPSIRSYSSGGWTRLAKHHGRIIVSGPSWCADLEQLQILTTKSTNRDNLKLTRFLTSCHQLLIPSD